MCDILVHDIGTEELGHFEMIGAIVYQLTRNLTIDEIKSAGFDQYFVDHTTGIYTVAASGMPFDASCYAAKGDVITDLHEDLAAEGAISNQPRTEDIKVSIYCTSHD